MADEKVRRVEHDFSGRPLRPYSELSTDGPTGEEYVDTTLYTTKDGRLAGQAPDRRFYLVHDGDILPDQPIDADDLE